MDERFREELLALGVKQPTLDILVAQELLTEADLVGMTEEDYTKLGVPLGSARKLVAKFSPPPSAPEVVAATTTTVSFDVLPPVPEDTSFVEMLRTGGVLKAPKLDVMSAMRAAIAAGLGMYDLPDRLMTEMDRFAEAQEEPYGENYFRLQKLISQHRYGEILTAMGATGNYVSEAKKKKMIQLLSEHLWPALKQFHLQLSSWASSWQGTANPMMALTMMAMSQSGSGTPLPPGMIMQPPETAPLRDEAEAVIAKINKVFAGPGIVVARAMAWDAMRIREILDDPSLPAAIGAATKEQMLKQLGVNVGSDFVRLERSVIRFALGILELSNIGEGNAELSYLVAMLQLGASIPWEKLGEPAIIRSSVKKGSVQYEGREGEVRHY